MHPEEPDLVQRRDQTGVDLRIWIADLGHESVAQAGDAPFALDRLGASDVLILEPSIVVPQSFDFFIHAPSVGALDPIVRDRLLRKRSGRHKSRAKRATVITTIAQN